MSITPASPPTISDIDTSVSNNGNDSPIASIQRGSKIATKNGQTNTISEVDMAKTFLRVGSVATTDSMLSSGTGWLVTSTTMRTDTGGSDTDIYWEVIEYA